jgi:hypothetical protein
MWEIGSIGHECGKPHQSDMDVGMALMQYCPFDFIIFSEPTSSLYLQSPYYSLLHPSTMPPRKVQEPPLSIPELLLLCIAARLDTAIRYKEALPDGDYSDWADKLGLEVMSLYILLVPLICN